MKVGIVGAGAVGRACLFAMPLRGSARELVLVNRNYERARGAVTDLQYGTSLTPVISLQPGDRTDSGHAQAGARQGKHRRAEVVLAPEDLEQIDDAESKITIHR